MPQLALRFSPTLQWVRFRAPMRIELMRRNPFLFQPEDSSESD